MEKNDYFNAGIPCIFTFLNTIENETFRKSKSRDESG